MNSNDRELAYMRFCENASGGIAERRDAFSAGWDAALAAKAAEQQKPAHEREPPHCPTCSCHPSGPTGFCNECGNAAVPLNEGGSIAPHDRLTGVDGHIVYRPCRGAR